MGDTVQVHGKSRLVMQVSGTGPYLVMVDHPLWDTVAQGSTVYVWCGKHDHGLRRPDNGQCLACPPPIIIEYVEVPCPGPSCVHYLYGMKHKHEFEV